MTHYVGLNVLRRTIAVCVLDHAGRRDWQGMCLTSPEVPLKPFSAPF